MKKQSGFTLIELAIVLVIIGLLLGGVLKGQELINSAKVKNMASDFKNIQVYIYGFQDRYRSLPGDDHAIEAKLAGSDEAAAGTQNSQIEGVWDSASDPAASEAEMVWQHVRLAGLAPGPTALDDPNYYPRNADGGLIGVQSVNGFTTIDGPTAITGAFVICSDGILGRFATQLDTTLDDGETSTGSVRAIVSGTTGDAVTTAVVNADPSANYTVCMSF